MAEMGTAHPRAGTVMNNQFSGPNAWHDYLSALEQATPVIEAVAVTDYYVTDTYEEMCGTRPPADCPAPSWFFRTWSSGSTSRQRKVASSISTCICSSARAR